MNNQLFIQNRNRSTDIENKFMDTKAEEEGVQLGVWG